MELLYLLFRTGVPTTLYYLDSVGKQELADHQTIVVPLPLAVSDAKAALLEELAREATNRWLAPFRSPIGKFSSAACLWASNEDPTCRR